MKGDAEQSARKERSVGAQEISSHSPGVRESYGLRPRGSKGCGELRAVFVLLSSPMRPERQCGKVSPGRHRIELVTERLLLIKRCITISKRFILANRGDVSDE